MTSKRKGRAFNTNDLSNLQSSIEHELKVTLSEHIKKQEKQVINSCVKPEKSSTMSAPSLNSPAFIRCNPNAKEKRATNQEYLTKNKKKPNKTNNRMSMPVVQASTTLSFQDLGTTIASSRSSEIRNNKKQIYTLSKDDYMANLQTEIAKPIKISNSNQIKNEQQIPKSKYEREYNKLLEIAQQKQYPDIEALKLIYLAGKDSLGRQIIIVEAANLPAKNINLQHVLLYCIKILDPIVINDYVLVFIGTEAKRTNRPPLDWLKKTYSMFNRKYKKNLKSLYIVHPNRWIRATLTLCRPFVSNKFWKKVVFIDNIDDIYKTINPSEITFSNHIIRYNSKINSRPPIFGSTLQEILKIEHNKTGIPEVVTKSVAYLRNHLGVQGIFRQSGLALHIEELKTAFNRGEDVDLSDEDDPHSVASLLKLFLRELADPVFTLDLHDTFLQIQATMYNIDEAWINTILNLIATLPKENLLVMKVIFDLAYEIQLQSHQNLMDCKNLSIVLGPNLLRGKNNEDTLAAMKDTPTCNSLVKKMIEHHDEIFGDEFTKILNKK